MSTLKSSRNIIASVFILFALALTVAGPSPAGAYFAPSNGQAATLVLGQANFTSGGHAAGQTRLFAAEGVAVDPTSHKIFVADNANNRVLRFASVNALANGAAAEAVLGQPNFTASAAHIAQNGMFNPFDVFVDGGGHLWVADMNNCRILRFDKASSLANGANASGVLGSANFTSTSCVTSQSQMQFPYSVYVDAGGRLWVADILNSRVLRFDNAAAKANGANADGVLGQANFTSSAATTTQNGMNDPAGVFGDASGRLWVADRDNNRILRFDNAAAKADGANADGVLGQADFTHALVATTQSGMKAPSGVTVDTTTGRLYVADYSNNRILLFNSAAGLANGANAGNVLGQTNFTTGTANTGGLSAASLEMPSGMFFDPTAKVLWAADHFNSRVLMYGKPSRGLLFTSVAADDGWVAESTETSGVGGSLGATGVLAVGDNASNDQYRSFLSFNTALLPDTAVIHAVTIKIKKAGVMGTDPLASFGSLLADIKMGTFGTAALQAADFQTMASATGIGHFTAISSQPGWYQLVVPASDYVHVNRTGVTQFRIRFSLDDNNNHIADIDTFYAGDAVTAADRPTLTVEYSLP